MNLQISNIGLLKYAYFMDLQMNKIGYETYVTDIAKRGLIHASNFPTLTSHNVICKQAIKLKFSVLLVQ